MKVYEKELKDEAKKQKEVISTLCYLLIPISIFLTNSHENYHAEGFLVNFSS